MSESVSKKVVVRLISVRGYFEILVSVMCVISGGQTSVMEHE